MQDLAANRTGTGRTWSRRTLIGALGVVALAAGALTATPTSASIGSGDATLISTFPTSIAPVYTTSTERVPGPTAGKPTGAETSCEAAIKGGILGTNPNGKGPAK